VVVVSGGTNKTQALAYMVAPTGSAAFRGSYVFASFTGFNRSTAARSTGATGSATITPAITTAAGGLPPIKPMGPSTAGAAKVVGVLGGRLGFTTTLAMLVIAIVCFR
jgi:hypothetical protein